MSDRIGTTAPRTCLRCGGGAYREHDPDCAHAYTLEELAPAPLIEHVTWMREALCLASHNGGPPHALHPTEVGARALFAERWAWGHGLAALFAWLIPPNPRERVDRYGARWYVRPRAASPDALDALRAKVLRAKVEALLLGERLRAHLLDDGLRAGVAAATGIASATERDDA